MSIIFYMLLIFYFFYFNRVNTLVQYEFCGTILVGCLSYARYYLSKKMSLINNNDVVLSNKVFLFHINCSLVCLVYLIVRRLLCFAAFAFT